MPGLLQSAHAVYQDVSPASGFPRALFVDMGRASLAARGRLSVASSPRWLLTRLGQILPPHLARVILS